MAKVRRAAKPGHAGFYGARLRSVTLLKVLGCVLATAFVCSAHHSLFAEFDRARESEHRVTVVSVEWGNPHSDFHATVLEQGHEVDWKFELPSPSGLIRKGWAPDSLRTGDVVRVDAFPAKDGSARASVRTVTLADGRVLEIDHPFNYQH